MSSYSPLVLLGLFIAIGHIPLYFHVRVYKQLLASIEYREGPVWTRRDYPGLRITSSALAMPHMKIIEERFSNSLTILELDCISKSRKLYYFGIFLIITIMVIFFAW